MVPAEAGPGLPGGDLGEVLVGVLWGRLQVLQHGVELRVVALVDVVPDDGELPTHLPQGAGGAGGNREQGTAVRAGPGSRLGLLPGMPLACASSPGVPTVFSDTRAGLGLGTRCPGGWEGVGEPKMNKEPERKKGKRPPQGPPAPRTSMATHVSICLPEVSPWGPAHLAGSGDKVTISGSAGAAPSASCSC